jgi:hypothetical protein
VNKLHRALYDRVATRQRKARQQAWLERDLGFKAGKGIYTGMRNFGDT